MLWRAMYPENAPHARHHLATLALAVAAWAGVILGWHFVARVIS